MPTYFKPLRRKFGVVTLLLALAFLASWVRSMGLNDYLKIEWNSNCANVLGSTPAGIVLQFDWEWDDDALPIEFKRNDVIRKKWWPSVEVSTTKVRRRTRGLTVGNTDKFLIWLEAIYKHHWRQVLPHWSIVIPLTLISAYLLVSKPRKPKAVPLS